MAVPTSTAFAPASISSTAWSPVDRAHESRGPTGFGVRLLLATGDRFFVYPTKLREYLAELG